MNRKSRIITIALSSILIMAILQTLPVFLLKPFGAREIKGKNIIEIYQTGDEKGAKEVYNILENSAEEIRKKLEFNSSEPTTVYVYDNQKSLWIRKFGFITIIGAPKWYIGDNKGEKVLMVSPYVKVEGHNHDSIINAATHELVHSINYRINSNLSYWMDNGVATFLAKQSPDKEFAHYNPIPTMDDMKSEDQVKFGNIGGYQYSYTYIEFLNKQYGWNKVLDLIKGEKSYNDIFSKSERDIYSEWVEYINKNHMF